MPKSKLENGFVVPPTHIELIVADHCNLSCRNCNHASPIVNKWYADPDTVRRDFGILAKHYRPRVVKVIGGEPLLHPRLAELILAARSTRISDHFLLVTNGALMERIDDAVLEVIDELEISVFAGVPRMDEMLRLACEKTERSGTTLTVNEFDHFRATFTSAGTEDQELVKQIYDSCKIANLWGAHSVRDGYLYRCPQSIYIPQITTGDGNFESDRIRIEDTEGFQDRLLNFVNASDPLASCTYCVGTVGRQLPHALVSRDRWHQDIDQPSEALIDYDWLKRSLVKQDQFDDCKIPARMEPETHASKSSWWRKLAGLASEPRSRASVRKRSAVPVRQTAADASREAEASDGAKRR